MARKDPRVTAYIAAAAPFARPILREIRAAVHEGCPSVEETLKWRMPSFVHRGLMGGMAAFKAHCTLWFWRGGLLPSLGPGKGGAMGQFGRLTSAADLPPRAHLVRLVREAAALNESLAAAPRAGQARPPGKARKIRGSQGIRRARKSGQPARLDRPPKGARPAARKGPATG